MTILRRGAIPLTAWALALGLIAGCGPLEPEESPPPPGSGDFEPGDGDRTAVKLDDMQIETIRQLPESDAEIALAQKVCPVGGNPLGSMGIPAKVEVNGIPIFLCCIGCEDTVTSNPEAVLARVPQGRPAATGAVAPAPTVAPAPAGDDS